MNKTSTTRLFGYVLGALPGNARSPPATPYSGLCAGQQKKIRKENMVELPKVQASPREIKILRLARRRKVLTIRDASFWECEELLHKGALNKFVATKGKGAGWPHYRLSYRGKKLLAYLDTLSR